MSVKPHARSPHHKHSLSASHQVHEQSDPVTEEAQQERSYATSPKTRNQSSLKRQKQNGAKKARANTQAKSKHRRKSSKVRS